MDDNNCPICFEPLNGITTASPDVCNHKFCLPCLQTWIKEDNVCPIDRKKFRRIISLDTETTIEVKPRKRKHQRHFYEFDYFCEVCKNESSDSNTLLLCDSCDLGYHSNCLSPPLTEVPTGRWQCPVCIAVELKLTSTGKHLTKRRKLMQKASERYSQYHDQAGPSNSLRMEDVNISVSDFESHSSDSEDDISKAINSINQEEIFLDASEGTSHIVDNDYDEFQDFDGFDYEEDTTDMNKKTADNQQEQSKSVSSMDKKTTDRQQEQSKSADILSYFPIYKELNRIAALTAKGTNLNESSSSQSKPQSRVGFCSSTLENDLSENEDFDIADDDFDTSSSENSGLEKSGKSLDGHNRAIDDSQTNEDFDIADDDFETSSSENSEVGKSEESLLLKEHNKTTDHTHISPSAINQNHVDGGKNSEESLHGKQCNLPLNNLNLTPQSFLQGLRESRNNVISYHTLILPSGINQNDIDDGKNSKESLLLKEHNKTTDYTHISHSVINQNDIDGGKISKENLHGKQCNLSLNDLNLAPQSFLQRIKESRNKVSPYVKSKTNSSNKTMVTCNLQENEKAIDNRKTDILVNNVLTSTLDDGAITFQEKVNEVNFSNPPSSSEDNETADDCGFPDYNSAKNISLNKCDKINNIVSPNSHKDIDVVIENSESVMRDKGSLYREHQDKSVADTRQSVDDTSQSVDDTSHSVGDTSQSVEDTSHSVDDTSHSVDDTTHSVDDTSNSSTNDSFSEAIVLKLPLRLSLKKITTTSGDQVVTSFTSTNTTANSISASICRISSVNSVHQSDSGTSSNDSFHANTAGLPHM